MFWYNNILLRKALETLSLAVDLWHISPHRALVKAHIGPLCISADKFLSVTVVVRFPDLRAVYKCLHILKATRQSPKSLKEC